MLRETGIDSCRKAKYILPLVLDTWNITKENGFKDVEIKTFNKPKPDIKDTIDKVRLRYHKHLVYNLVINDEFCLIIIRLIIKAHHSMIVIKLIFILFLL